MTRITGILHEDQYTLVITSQQFLLKMRNVWNKSCKENKKNTYVQQIFFRKSCRLWCKKKHCRAGQATDDSMAHAHCMLYT